MTAVEDLEAWNQKTVGLTESIELVNLEKYAQYAVAVAARTKTVSFKDSKALQLTKKISFQGLGRLSEKVTVKVKPEDVPLNLRASDVSTHSMILSWATPIRINPVNYKVIIIKSKSYSNLKH
jgi:receptor-type tyrosine-protein phosphatase F